MPSEPCWHAAARWWLLQEPDLTTAELAEMLGLAERTLRAEVIPSRPERPPAAQRRADEVKAAVRAGLDYDTLAKRFDWPH